MKRVRLTTLIGAAALLWTSALNAQSLERVVVQEGSRLWIEGASTVNEWTCAAGSLQGRAIVATEEVVREAAVEPSARLAVPVKSFECGRERMNNDFARALRASQYPEIQYQLTDAQVLDEESTTDGWIRLNVRGELSIAGTTRTIETVAMGRRLQNGQFQVRGSKELTMTSFGIRPPVALLGLVKAHDEIEVHFDLVAGNESIAVR